jgi:cell division septation protein DedD
VVQVFASQSAADAGILRDKLSAKGYPAYISEADLGKKGLWYRVLFGPYADKDRALQAQTFADEKDKLKGFVKHR